MDTDKHTKFHDNPIMNLMATSTVAIETAASRLNMSAIDLAEALQGGGIAELVEIASKLAAMVQEHNEWKPDNVPIHAVNDAEITYGDARRCRAILAKIRKEGKC